MQQKKQLEALILQEEMERKAIEDKISNIHFEEEKILQRIQSTQGEEISTTQQSQSYSSPKKNGSLIKSCKNGGSSSSGKR
jgi:hypothetical protein